MAKDKPLKSSYELAMERLREKDREKGIDEPKPLTAKQKKKIAGLRSRAEAQLAEIEIMHDKQVAAAQGDPEQLAKLEEQRQIDRRRVASRVESDVARVKRGEDPQKND